MSYKLEFEKLVDFDTDKSGISLNVELRLNSESVNFEAKIDTGASFCIFAREYARNSVFVSKTVFCVISIRRQEIFALSVTALR